MYGIVKYSPMNVRTSWSTSVYATEYIPPANVYAIEMIALAQTQGTTLSVKNQYITFVQFEVQPRWNYNCDSRQFFWSCSYLSCQEWQLRLFLERIKLLLSNKYRQCKMANKRWRQRIYHMLLEEHQYMLHTTWTEACSQRTFHWSTYWKCQLGLFQIWANCS